jgi:hypothetical protein
MGCCYKFLTFICGIPAALMWGCIFACIAFEEVWCITPMVRSVNITLTNIKKLVSIILASK